MENQTSVLDKSIVLSLNSLWQPIGFKAVRDAVTAMNSADFSVDRAAVGLNIEYAQNEDGSYDMAQAIGMTPVKWEDWVKLPVRSFDYFIQGVRGKIRVPTVIISVNYSKMPIKRIKATKSAIYDRDGGVCQYSGKKLSRKEGTIDHVIPRDVWKREGRHGSPDTWENQVLCDATINHTKGNKMNAEAGLKLIRQPRAPNATAVAALITEARHRDWEHFLVRTSKKSY